MLWNITGSLSTSAAVVTNSSDKVFGNQAGVVALQHPYVERVALSLSKGAKSQILLDDLG
ncbi:hypothetical protein V2H45_25065 [Tumidithrix elongata RA019]|uniref:Uncharacterized protein n=1 Tax=Tumidithrix elongata BACA0141 TaxID=2716417 RepID=A0AAW9PZU0_9CYAN|nr:hypothetical protein [Tumidithrix elongata RA019]